jgi:hypothetical protein
MADDFRHPESSRVSQKQAIARMVIRSSSVSIDRPGSDSALAAAFNLSIMSPVPASLSRLRHPASTVFGKWAVGSGEP